METNIELSRYSGNMPVVNKQGWESPVCTIVKKMYECTKKLELHEQKGNFLTNV